LPPSSNPSESFTACDNWKAASTETLSSFTCSRDGFDVNDETTSLFEQAYEKWKTYCARPEVMEQSRDEAYINNGPFREIVALGEEALPLIIRKLNEDEGAHFLIHALSAITGKRFSSEELDKAAARSGSPLGNQGFARLWIEWWETRNK
jgi:hypothetical protein